MPKKSSQNLIAVPARTVNQLMNAFHHSSDALSTEDVSEVISEVLQEWGDEMANLDGPQGNVPEDPTEAAAAYRAWLLTTMNIALQRLQAKSNEGD